MSSNVTFLALGLVLGGRLTDAFGPRWVWGAAALLSSVAAVVGYALARGAVEAPAQIAEPPQAQPEPEPAVEAHGGARRAI